MKKRSLGSSKDAASHALAPGHPDHPALNGAPPPKYQVGSYKQKLKALGAFESPVTSDAELDTPATASSRRALPEASPGHTGDPKINQWKPMFRLAKRALLAIMERGRKDEQLRTQLYKSILWSGEHTVRSNCSGIGADAWIGLYI